MIIREDALSQYLQLLHQWNQTFNLTAVRNIDDMMTKHILDSLAILPWIQGTEIIDVGTGAGLPGIPIAIAHPKLKVTLLDSNSKKINFLHEVKRTLRLENIAIIQSRVETYHPPSSFDTVITRAFSNIQQMCLLTQHLLKNQGIWLAMKGQAPLEELAEIEFAYEIQPYTIPNLDAQRCCVIIKNNRNTHG